MPENSDGSVPVTPASVVKNEQKVALVSFSVKATVPTQQYGNIQPEIVVKAGTVQDAIDHVMPFIEGLYQRYAEAPANGNTPAFYNKANVVVVERKVEQVAPTPAPEPKPKTEQVIVTKQPAAPTATAPVSYPVEKAEPKGESVIEPVPFEKDESYKRAEGALLAAASKDAVILIEDQIKRSTRIVEDQKPHLYTVALKLRGRFINL